MAFAFRAVTVITRCEVVCFDDPSTKWQLGTEAVVPHRDSRSARIRDRATRTRDGSATELATQPVHPTAIPADHLPYPAEAHPQPLVVEVDREERERRPRVVRAHPRLGDRDAGPVRVAVERAATERTEGECVAEIAMPIAERKLAEVECTDDAALCVEGEVVMREVVMKRHGRGGVAGERDAERLEVVHEAVDRLERGFVEETVREVLEGRWEGRRLRASGARVGDRQQAMALGEERAGRTRGLGMTRRAERLEPLRIQWRSGGALEQEAVVRSR